jgi:hypothetical protein
MHCRAPRPTWGADLGGGYVHGHASDEFDAAVYVETQYVSIVYVCVCVCVCMCCGGVCVNGHHESEELMQLCMSRLSM